MEMEVLMKEWWDNAEAYDRSKVLCGENENSEMVVVTMTKEYFGTETVQRNDWVRENRWYRDGTSTERYTK